MTPNGLRNTLEIKGHHYGTPWHVLEEWYLGKSDLKVVLIEALKFCAPWLERQTWAQGKGKWDQHRQPHTLVF
jgi:hypothetical protein